VTDLGKIKKQITNNTEINSNKFPLIPVKNKTTTAKRIQIPFKIHFAIASGFLFNQSTFKII
jgi:hypothetical protein